MTTNKQTPKKRAGPGRPKGSPNRTTAALKDALMIAAEETGRDGKGKHGLVGYLKWLAVEEPKTFGMLLGKIIPTQITGDLTVRQAATMSDDELAAIASGSRTTADPAPVDQGKLH